MRGGEAYLDVFNEDMRCMADKCQARASRPDREEDGHGWI